MKDDAYEVKTLRKFMQDNRDRFISNPSQLELNKAEQLLGFKVEEVEPILGNFISSEEFNLIYNNLSNLSIAKLERLLKSWGLPTAADMTASYYNK